MKIKKFSTVIVFLIGLVLLPVTSVRALTVELNFSSTKPRPTETFTMDIIVNGVFDGLDPFEGVLAFGFDVFISDSSLVGFVGATVAPPFFDDSAFFPDTDVAGSVFPGIPNDPANNTIPLATVTYEALAVGDPSLGITSDASDFNEGLIYFLAGNADITARGDVNVIPEPGSVFLLGIGLITIVSVKRKFRKKLQCSFKTGRQSSYSSAFTHLQPAIPAIYHNK